ncbi:ABC transporter substrate-binding protein [Paenibacillus segetis]|uniref:Sugar ABC transporter substrate-binding protein n=1 Tax=Paenibacillus segetis TaxID=1325360 RepID=A0ABQ1YLE3_9BACL|nr:ABC transporter substrate-binding protein [Paenibacillus segetis]GGH28815.1 sugar ABC transporter substrate-binding protein [Paenibacillus segetis]
MKFKKVLIATVASVMAMSLAGCGEKENGASKSTDNSPGAANDVKTVTLLTFTEWYKDGWKALESYINNNAQELGFKLDIQKIAGGSQGEDVVKARFATGDLPDIIQTYGAKWIDTQVNGLDKIVDMGSLSSEAEYDAATLEEGGYRYDGKLYGMPMDTTNLLGVFYNKKVFEEAGITELPQNWEQFIAVSDKIKATGKTPLYYSGKDAWTLQCFTHFGFNKEVFDSGKSYSEFWQDMNTNKRHYAENKQFANAIAKSKEMIELGYVNETYLSDTYDMAQTALAQGEAGMYINATWVIDEISSKYPDAVQDIGAFALPLYDASENYTDSSLPSSLSITTSAKDIEATKKAIDFISSAKAQQIYAEAQPGIYLNKNVNVTLSPGHQDLLNLMKEGKSMALWQGSGNNYGYGSYDKFLQDYYVSSKSVDEVLKAMDEETAKNAMAAKDSNWK